MMIPHRPGGGSDLVGTGGHSVASPREMGVKKEEEEEKTRERKC